ncbi:hypothetical protein V1527DRAFT_455119 [Lipomyces starkeyi]
MSGAPIDAAIAACRIVRPLSLIALAQLPAVDGDMAVQNDVLLHNTQMQAVRQKYALRPRGTSFCLSAVPAGPAYFYRFHDDRELFPGSSDHRHYEPRARCIVERDTSISTPPVFPLRGLFFQKGLSG